MSRYVITIAPDNGAGAALTTVRVDTSSGQTRVTELTVEAGSVGGLAPADLPALDLDLLVRALTGAVVSGAGAGLPAAAQRTTLIQQPAAPSGRRAAAPRARKAAAGAKATARKAAARTAGATKRTTTKATRAKATAGRKAVSGSRAYRRMPEPDQVMAAYQRTGSITAVAEHFDVPRHTVAGWARRLRSMGYAIGRS